MSPGLKTSRSCFSPGSSPDSKKGMYTHSSDSASVELQNRPLPALISTTVRCSCSCDGPWQVPHCSQANWHRSQLVVQTAQFKGVACFDDSCHRTMTYSYLSVFLHLLHQCCYLGDKRSFRFFHRKQTQSTSDVKVGNHIVINKKYSRML